MSTIEARPTAPIGAGPEQAAARRPHIPGEAGIWVLIAGEVLAFTVLFGIWLHGLGDHPAEWEAGRQRLDVDYAVVDTLLLLVSSLCVVLGVRAIRHQVPRVAPALFAAAMLCGLGFSISKVVEWGGHIDAGETVQAGDFWMYYYALTGMHFLHLLLGMGVLGWCLAQARKPRLSDRRFGFVEGGACFWHMVDLLWIVLFPLIYLVH